MKQLLAILLTLSAAITAAAGDTDSTLLRPVHAAYTVEAGSAHLADTYLTPLRYSGWSASLRYSRMQATRFNPRDWVLRMDFAADVSRTLNPVRNATMWYWGLDFTAALMRRVWHRGRFSAMVGPDIDLTLGALYSPRNGNNPVAAKAAVTVGVAGQMSYAARIGRIPVTLLWQPALPVTGVFFSPDYGQLYYEIYLGERSGLARAAWWGHHFRLDNLIAADIRLGGTSLRIGYRLDYLSQSASHITSRTITHAAVIGITGEWLSVNPRRASADPRIISPL